MQSTEKWAPIRGYDGAYEVSDHGRVRSLDRVDSAQRRLRGRLLRPTTRAKYQSVTLSSSGVHRYFYVHRLVAQAFVFNPDPSYEVCHIDGDRLNNHASNLRWDSHQANQMDMVKHGTHLHARKTHCKHGHEFTPENIYQVKSGKRKCATCSRASAKRAAIRKESE